MSITSQINRLLQAKADIKSAIENKGGTVSSSAKLNDYAGLINNLAFPVAQPLSVTSNGTYSASSGYAYNPVTVNVQGGGGGDEMNKLITRTLSGSYYNADISKIGKHAFANCIEIDSISFPNVTEVGSNAFYSCNKLTEVSLPNCVSLGNYTFAYCSSLWAISLPECTETGIAAFMDCENLRTVNMPKLSFVASSAFRDTKLQNVIMSQCEEIRQYAFADNTLGLNCSFPNLKTIQSSAFTGCYHVVLHLMGSSLVSLTSTTGLSRIQILSIYVPESLVSIYKSANAWSKYSNQIHSAT